MEIFMKTFQMSVLLSLILTSLLLIGCAVSSDIAETSQNATVDDGASIIAADLEPGNNDSTEPTVTTVSVISPDEKGNESPATEPQITDPQVTEPVTEPQVTEPQVIEPQVAPVEIPIPNPPKNDAEVLEIYQISKDEKYPRFEAYQKIYEIEWYGETATVYWGVYSTGKSFMQCYGIHYCNDTLISDQYGYQTDDRKTTISVIDDKVICIDSHISEQNLDVFFPYRDSSGDCHLRGVNGINSLYRGHNGNFYMAYLDGQGYIYNNVIFDSAGQWRSLPWLEQYLPWSDKYKEPEICECDDPIVIGSLNIEYYDLLGKKYILDDGTKGFMRLDTRSDILWDFGYVDDDDKVYGYRYDLNDTYAVEFDYYDRHQAQTDSLGEFTVEGGSFYIYKEDGETGRISTWIIKYRNDFRSLPWIDETGKYIESLRTNKNYDQREEIISIVDGSPDTIKLEVRYYSGSGSNKTLVDTVSEEFDLNNTETVIFYYYYESAWKE